MKTLFQESVFRIDLGLFARASPDLRAAQETLDRLPRVALDYDLAPFLETLDQTLDHL